ncbi:alpha/beta fold hydrolase [Methylopila henanensis]|uniref:Alpha/beta fold hydrolase n=1 Tax=Methylopila henanensis TaxID=873516 RepID=A0ABW4K3Z5_9HYPH
MTPRRRDLLLWSAAASTIGLRAAAQAAPGPSNAAGLESRYLDLDDVRLRYVVAGEGPTVVLLHGWPETSSAWSGVIRRLAGRFRLIAPDLRGVGGSSIPTTGYSKQRIAADVATLIEREAGGAAAVVGHDMGGKAAYVLALTQPGRVSRLVLVDCLLPGTENGDALRGGAWHYGFHMAEGFAELLTQGRERDYIAAQIRAWSHVKDAIPEADIAAYAQAYARPGRMTAGFGLYRALPEDAAFAAGLRSRTLAMPVMTVAGRSSAGTALSKAVEPQAPNHAAVVIENCGHFVAAEATDVLCDSLASFLDA